MNDNLNDKDDGESILDEGLNSTSSNTVKPPRMFVVFFKLLAVILFVGTIVVHFVYITPVFTRVSGILELIPEFKNAYLFFKVWNITLLLLLISTVVFAWGIFKLRKWVVPFFVVDVLFSGLMVVISIINGLVHHDSISVILMASFALKLILPIIFGVLVYRYRRYLNGSYKCLVPQIIWFFIMVPTLIFVSAGYAFTDLRVIADEDLVSVEVFNIQADQNAQVLLESIYEDRYVTDDIGLYLDGSDWNQEEVDEILFKNKTVLEVAREASQLPYYFCPHYTEVSTPNTELCPINSLRDVSKVVNISALDFALKGEYQKALDESMISIQIGQLMLEAPRLAMIDYLVAVSLQGGGLETIKLIITEYDIPQTVRLSILYRLESYFKVSKGLKTALSDDYQMVKNGMDTTVPIGSSYIFHPNRMMNDYADFIRYQIVLADEDCSTIDYEKFEKYRESLDLWSSESGFIKFLKPNAIGEKLKSFVLGGSLNTNTRRCVLEEKLNEVKSLLGESKSPVIEDSEVEL